MAIYFAVDGPVGSGKTELVKSLQQNLPRNKYRIECEPVEQYSQVAGHHQPINLLRLSYTHPKQYAFKSQIHINHVNRRHFSSIKKANAPHSSRHVITERCPRSSLIFLESYKKAGVLTDLDYDLVKEDFHDKITSMGIWSPDVIFYLNTPFDDCWSRVLQRDRPGEREGFALMKQMHSDYLAHLSKLYSGSEIVVVPDYVCARPKEEVFRYVRNALDYMSSEQRYMRQSVLCKAYTKKSETWKALNLEQKRY